MICYRCNNVRTCDWVRFAYSDEFEISKCKNFSEMTEYRYKHIAENEALLKLIYDYFTDNVDGHSLEEAKEAITRTIIGL